MAIKKKKKAAPKKPEEPTVSDKRYVTKYNRIPNGEGNWWFTKHANGVNHEKHKEGEDHFMIHGKYTQAMKRAQQWAKEKGHKSIHVCEQSEITREETEMNRTLIHAALQSKPLEFQSAFETVILDKVRDLIDQKRDEVAYTMVNTVEDPYEGQDPAEFAEEFGQLHEDVLASLKKKHAKLKNTNPEEAKKIRRRILDLQYGRKKKGMAESFEFLEEEEVQSLEELYGKGQIGKIRQYHAHMASVHGNEVETRDQELGRAMKTNNQWLNNKAIERSDKAINNHISSEQKYARATAIHRAVIDHNKIKELQKSKKSALTTAKNAKHERDFS